MKLLLCSTYQRHIVCTECPYCTGKTPMTNRYSSLQVWLSEVSLQEFADKECRSQIAIATQKPVPESVMAVLHGVEEN